LWDGAFATLIEALLARFCEANPAIVLADELALGGDRGLAFICPGDWRRCVFKHRIAIRHLLDLKASTHLPACG
jgi:hypothetical protein